MRLILNGQKIPLQTGEGLVKVGKASPTFVLEARAVNTHQKQDLLIYIDGLELTCHRDKFLFKSTFQQTYLK